MHTAPHTYSAPPRQPLFDMDTVAKRLNMGKYKLMAWLREMDVLERDRHGNNVPTSRYMRAGYFYVVNTRHWNDRCGWIYHAHTKFTKAGLDWILKKYAALENVKNEKVY